MKGFKRWMAWGLSALMTMSAALPVTAYADDSTVPVIVVNEGTASVDNVTVVEDLTQGDDPEVAVGAYEDGASVTVSGDVSADVDMDEARDAGYVGDDQMGWSAVVADGGSVSVGGDVKATVDFVEDEGEGDNVRFSGVDVNRGGEAAVGGNVTIETGLDPYTHLAPDTEDRTQDEWYYSTMLGHHTMGVNNEGGTATVDGTVTVADSHYGIGLDAGGKYKVESVEDQTIDYFLESGSFGEDLEEAPDDFSEKLPGYISDLAGTIVLEDQADTAAIQSGDVNVTGGMYSKGMYVRSNGSVQVDGNVTSGNLQLSDEALHSEARTEANEGNWMIEDQARTACGDAWYDMTPEEQDAYVQEFTKQALSRTTGVHNQGIVAEGYAGFLGDAARQELYSVMTEIYGEDYDWSDYAGIGNFVPWSRETLARFGEDEFISSVGKAVLADGDKTSATVTGDVTAYGGMVTKGVTAFDASVTVGGAVSAQGDDAIGILAVGDDAQVSAGSLKVEGRDAAAGVVSFAGETEIGGDVVVQSDDAGTGVTLSAGHVTVDGDVSVTADESTGVKTLALDNRMVLIMGLATSEWYQGGGDPLFYEAVWNCLNRYSDEMNTGDLLAYFMTEDQDPASLVVDGTVTAKDGVAVVDTAMMAKIMEDFVVNCGLYSTGYLEEDADPRAMSDDELKQKADDLAAQAAALDPNSEQYQRYPWMYRNDLNRLQQREAAYKAVLALREVGREQAQDPDVTVWRIDAENETVKHGTETFSWKDFLNEWTFILPGDGLGLDAPDWEDSTVQIDYNSNGAADKAQANINYIIRIGSVTGGDGTISLDGTRDSHGYATAREGEEVTVYVTCAEGYEVESISGLYATLVKNADGSWTLVVPEGGGVQIDAVLRAIEKAEEEDEDEDPDDPIVIPVDPDPDPEPEEEPEEETEEETESETEPEVEPVPEPEIVPVSVPAPLPASLEAPAASATRIGLLVPYEELTEGSEEELVWQRMQVLAQDPAFVVTYRTGQGEEKLQENLKWFADNGYDLVLAVGGEMVPVVKQAAEEYPAVDFALLAGQDPELDLEKLENLAVVLFTEDGQPMEELPTERQVDLALREEGWRERGDRFENRIDTFDTAD